jgi:hypothetical protein
VHVRCTAKKVLLYKTKIYKVNCRLHVSCTSALNYPVTSQTLKPIQQSYTLIYACREREGNIFVTNKQPDINTLCLGHIITSQHFFCLLILRPVNSHLYCLDVQLTSVYVHVLMFCRKLIIITSSQVVV